MSYFDSQLQKRFAECVLQREQMHLYQDEAYEFLLANPFSALFIDMGLGKTVTGLTVATDLLKWFKTEKVLVIGPKRVATETWPTEIGRWWHTAEHNFRVIYASDDHPALKEARARARMFARQEGVYDAAALTSIAARAETAEKERIRIQQTNSKDSIHVIPVDWVEWLCYYWKENWPYRTVLIDESSGFKDHASGRFKALAKTRRTEGLITRLHEFTATPAAETYEHLFAQLYLMDLGERLGKNITTYRKRYFYQDRYSYKWQLRPGAEEEILAKISDICLVMKGEDYLPLEKPVIVPRYVSMNEEQYALYQQMQDDLVIEIDGDEVEAETAAALSQKLLQMASGVVYDTKLVATEEDPDQLKRVRKVHRIHDHKVEALQQIVEEAQGQSLLIAYHHKSSLTRLREAFPKAVVMDADGKCVKRWNDGKIPMLLMHPASGGHGLNLQRGGHHIVFFDLPWSLELYLQLIGRLARQGQTKVVVVQVLLCKGTLDEDVFAALCEKEDAQARLFNILKRMIRDRKSL